MKKITILLALLVLVPVSWAQSLVNVGTGAVVTINLGANISADSRSGCFMGNGTFNWLPLRASPVQQSASAIAQNGFTANWETAPYATGYYLDVAYDSLFTAYVDGYQNRDVGNVTSYTADSGIASGTLYYYRVRMYDVCYWGPNSGTVSLITLPSDPVALAATDMSYKSFTANWNTVSGATGYRLDVATDSGFAGFVSGYNDLDAGLDTSHGVSGLAYGTSYFYRVRSTNISGSSGNSNTIMAVTLANLGPAISLVTQPADPQTGPGPYLVRAEITDPAKSGKSIAADSLYWRYNGGAWSEVAHDSVNGSYYMFSMPAIDTALAEYYVMARDDMVERAVSGTCSFRVDTLHPVISGWHPADQDTGIALNDTIWIAFSEGLRKSSFEYTVTPLPAAIDTVWSMDSTAITFVHDLLAPGTRYTIRLTAAVDGVGNALNGIDSLSFVTEQTTGITDQTAAMLPAVFALQAPYPNPARQGVSFIYQLPVASEVRLSIYNVSGQLVKTVVNGCRPAGQHRAQWDCMNGSERAVSGVYLYRLRAGSFTASGKVILLR